MKNLLLFAAVASLVGAAPSAASQAPVADADVDSIAYAEQTMLQGVAASCGAPRCPVYSVIVNADGSARFEGRETAVAAKRFRVSPATWRALVDRLARYRPALSTVVEPGSPACVDGIALGRDPVTMVSWTVGRRTDRIRLNGACRGPASEEAATAIEAARAIFFELLPLSKFVDGDQQAR